ncbi:MULTISPECIES: hypothetical protein [unclassified Micromonospora]|uniref:hypothetical protein n=1 Tax=unclassified Micromonospora TaxID=2617518 RepID=UPI001C2495DD|nr:MULTISPECIES: hypothetical protein [unclassified Micromonospora]MBU8855869.1 hypothetical protein [Micromonospora sp. WMMB482]MDM4781472.1 hypothetical protein [Micromonospora sp. b486]
MTLSQIAIEKTTKLVEFLAEVTAAVERDPVCDIRRYDLAALEEPVWAQATMCGRAWLVMAAVTADPSAGTANRRSRQRADGVWH